MRSRLARGAVLTALIAGLLWYLLRPSPPARDAEDAAASPAGPASLPDQKSPPLTADNSSLSGLAPGFSPAAGEKEDRVTAMDSPSRVLVRAPAQQAAARRPPTRDAALDPATAKVTPAHGEGDVLTPLDVRDPAALVMPPADAGINGDDTPPPPKTRKKRKTR